jgi:glyoxylase-like metal-dependent hydrolase (beta-lactamase superfamily II)
VKLIFEQIRAGGDRNFGYLLADRDSRTGVLIDPSYSPDAFVQRATDQGLTITHIINTHGHHDHVNGNARAAELTGAVVAAHAASPAAPSCVLADGQKVAVGDLQLNFLHVPGHADDHLVAYEPSCGILVTGDLLFVGKVGGTETDEDSRTEWKSLQRLLTTIPDACTVWPGHDYGVRPSSTMGMERTTNPFLLCADEASFLRLKHEWPEYKRRHGLK